MKGRPYFQRLRSYSDSHENEEAEQRKRAAAARSQVRLVYEAVAADCVAAGLCVSVLLMAGDTVRDRNFVDATALNSVVNQTNGKLFFITGA